MPLHLALGNKESYEGWLEFLRNLVARGLPVPSRLYRDDGAPGLLRALEEVFPQSVRPDLSGHKMQNVLGKLPEAARTQVKEWLRAVRDAPTLEQERERAAQVIELYEREYPAAMKSFTDDLEASLAPRRVGAVGASQVRAHHQPDRASL